MADRSPTPKKMHPDNEDFDNLSKAEIIARFREQDQYIKQLEAKRTKYEKDDDVDYADRMKQQQKEAARRENTLVHRLTTKEQELQDLMNQIAEMKQAHTQGTAQLKSMLLDPAVNIVFQRMAKEMEEAQEKLKQTQNELSAWKFTPDSQTGKRLMARCQMLLQENEELGKTIASGRTAKLEGEIALQKTLVTEMKNNQSELDEFLGDLEEDVEGMQTMIYVLQQQLREAKDHIAALEEENSQLRSGSSSATIKIVPKKPDKMIEKNIIKSENINQNSQTTLTTKYSYFENEKTDSDLEAEYNYEGLYENEDKIQEDIETEETAESGQYGVYEDNSYKQYEEDYESQNYKNSPESEISQELEAMETDDNQTDVKTEKTRHEKNKSTNHTNHSSELKIETEIAHSSEVTTSQTHSQKGSNKNMERKQGVDGEKTDSSQNIMLGETDTAASGEALCKIEKNGQLSRSDKEETDDLRIPSPKPVNCCQVKLSSSKSRTSDGDACSNNTDKSKVTTTKDHSPKQTRTSPVLSKLYQSVENSTDEMVTESTETNISSPGSAAKEREPVLQKFMNGVTSTVDDIEDL